MVRTVEIAVLFFPVCTVRTFMYSVHPYKNEKQVNTYADKSKFEK